MNTTSTAAYPVKVGQSAFVSTSIMFDLPAVAAKISWLDALLPNERITPKNSTNTEVTIRFTLTDLANIMIIMGTSNDAAVLAKGGSNSAQHTSSEERHDDASNEIYPLDKRVPFVFLGPCYGVGSRMRPNLFHCGPESNGDQLRLPQPLWAYVRDGFYEPDPARARVVGRSSLIIRWSNTRGRGLSLPLTAEYQQSWSCRTVKLS